jgi:hypothetical protein
MDANCYIYRKRFCTKWGFLTNRNFAVCVIITLPLLFNNLVIYLIVQSIHVLMCSCCHHFCHLLCLPVFFVQVITADVVNENEFHLHKSCFLWYVLIVTTCYTCLFFTYAYVLSVTLFSISSENYLRSIVQASSSNEQILNATAFSLCFISIPTWIPQSFTVLT